MILARVDVADIMDCRPVCKTFRDTIDSPVMISHLKRATLIKYVQTPAEYFECDWVRGEHKQHALIKVGFTKLGEGLFDATTTAVFSQVKAWQEQFVQKSGAIDDKNDYWDYLMDGISQLGGHLDPTWCLKIGSAIFDVGNFHPGCLFNITHSSGSDDQDTLESVSISQGLIMMRNCRSEARAFKNLMLATTGKNYTYSHEEDCFRHVLRTHHRYVVAQTVLHGHIKRAAARKFNLYDGLKPLWGGAEPLEKIKAPWSLYETQEDEAVEVISRIKESYEVADEDDV